MGTGIPPTCGAELGTETVASVSVRSGLFAVELGFGAAPLGGQARCLAVQVRCTAGPGTYTALSPRQALTPAPYALFAPAAGGVPWAGLTGMPDGLADGDDDTTYTAGTGLGLSGTEFRVSQPYRLPQGCFVGQIAEWARQGSWVCGDDAGTTPGTHFLGTLDPQALELRVNSERTLRLEPTGSSPNLIGGHGANQVAEAVVGATIGGGGRPDAPNQVSGEYSTVSGGYINTASGPYATVAGGEANLALGRSAAAGDGALNVAAGDYAIVGGGRFSQASVAYATIGGGGQSSAEYGNRVTDECGTVGGGCGNQAGDGDKNPTEEAYATVGGGNQNTAGGIAATVGGGSANQANGRYAPWVGA